MTNGLLSAASIVAASGLASRALGLLRDRIFADRFGAGAVLDAYFIAYRIPDLLYNLLVLGALAAAFLPVISRYLAQGPAGHREAIRVANALLTISVVGLGAVAVVLAISATLIVPLLAPQLDPERRELAVLFTRIMLLQPMLLAASHVIGGFLLAHQRFWSYAMAPVFYNFGIITGALLFVPAFGLAGLAWGVVLGAGLHLLAQVPAALRVGFRFRPEWSLGHEGLRDLGRLFLPRLIALLGGQVSALTVTALGSGLLAGSITAYLFAENLQAVPLGVIGVPMAVAAFPLLSAAAARADQSAFSETLVRALRLILFLTLPASVFILLLRAQVVRVVLGTGLFDWEDTVITFNLLGILALSVVAQSCIPLLARAFFSLHDTRSPMRVSLLAIAINIGAALILTPRLGIAGLAWAYSGSALLHFLLLLAVLHVRLGELQDRVLLPSVLRAATATLVAALVIQGPAIILGRLGWSITPSAVTGFWLYGLKGLIANLVNMQTFYGVAVQLLGSLFGGALAFLAVARLLGSSELSHLREVIHLPRRSAQRLAPLVPEES